MFVGTVETTSVGWIWLRRETCKPAIWWTNYARIARWIAVDADLAFTCARFTDDNPSGLDRRVQRNSAAGNWMVGPPSSGSRDQEDGFGQARSQDGPQFVQRPTQPHDPLQVPHGWKPPRYLARTSRPFLLVRLMLLCRPCQAAQGCPAASESLDKD